jgi:hypothetical protein
MGSKPSFEKTEISADWIVFVVVIFVVVFYVAKVVFNVKISQFRNDIIQYFHHFINIKVCSELLLGF